MLKDSVLAVTEQSEAVHWLCAHLLCLLLSLAPFYDNLSLSANMFTYIQTIQSNQGLRWLGHMVWTPNDRLRKKRLFTEIASHSVGGGVGGFAFLIALALVSMVLYYLTAKLLL